ncbi:MAG: hypothetical protein AB1847_23405 [bacterium]
MCLGSINQICPCLKSALRGFSLVDTADILHYLGSTEKVSIPHSYLPNWTTDHHFNQGGEHGQ